jgi:hypothetical protein
VQENGPSRVWSPDRFDAAGKITMEMAAGALRRDATQDMKEKMQLRLAIERQQVKLKMKEQVEEFMRLGADITKTTCRGWTSVASVTSKQSSDSQENISLDCF